MLFVVVDNGQVVVYFREDDVRKAKSQKQHVLAFRECDRDKELCYHLITVNVIANREKAEKALEELAMVLIKNLCGVVKPHIYVCVNDIHHYLLGVAPPLVKIAHYCVKPYSSDDQQLVLQAFIKTFADVTAKAVTLAFTLLNDPSTLRQAISLESALADLVRNAYYWRTLLERLGLRSVNEIMGMVKAVLDFAIEKVRGW
jgi:hypothetical protein